MIFDTHAHYGDDQFDGDRDELLIGMADAGVGTIVEIGASMQSSRDAVRLAEKYPFVYAAAGVHPDHVGELNEETMEELRQMCRNEKVVAVGEIGLDYHWDTEPREVQKYWFISQLNLAREMGLPVNIHSRDAAEDTMAIMKEHAQGLGGIIHCFSYSREMAKEYVKMGFSIGVGGVVTFKNGRKIKEIVKEIPLERIVLETDCPYLAPEPNRGRRNDSRNIHYVAQQIAEIKGIDKETVIKQTENNAKLIYFS